MDNPSSTSSFERVPWRGLVAVALVVALDTFGLGVRSAVWPWLATRVPPTDHLERGVVRDRLALRSLQDDARQRPRVLVLGSSRANAAFALSRRLERLSPIAFGKLAHAAIDPFALRSSVEEALAYSPAAVVWGLSEFDTHRPVDIVPAATFGSLSAVVDLLRETDRDFALRKRGLLYRLTLAGLLDSYRYRDVFFAAGLSELRRFALDDRLTPRGKEKRTPTIPGGPRSPLPRAEALSLLERLKARFPNGPVRAEFRGIRAITRGDHARVQMGLIRRGLRKLTAAGVEVVIAELPLHPDVARIYDASIREEFLDFARALSKDDRIRFIPLEATGPFPDEDFLDLTHVTGGGRLKLTRAILENVREALSSRTRLLE